MMRELLHHSQWRTDNTLRWGKGLLKHLERVKYLASVVAVRQYVENGCGVELKGDSLKVSVLVSQVWGLELTRSFILSLSLSFAIRRNTVFFIRLHRE